MNSLLSAIKAFVLKNRPAYKDYLGNGKYDVKKLPEECVPDSVNNKIRIAQSTANDAQSTANDANRKARDAQSTASDALSTATGTATQINDVTTFVTEFASLEATKNKEKYNFAENIRSNGTSALPFAEARAPMKCYFDITLNDSSNHNIIHYVAFEGKIVREVTKRSDTYCLFIDESVEVVNECFARLKIGYKFSNDDNLWHKFIRAEVTLPDADYNNTSITTIILNARGVIPDTYNYAPWPSICVPLAGTNDAGVVYASDKTDDQTVPVSIDKNGYLWCKGSEKPIVIEAEVNMSNGTVNLTADGVSKMNTLNSRYENENPCPAYLHYAVNGENVYSALIFAQRRNYYVRKDDTVSIYVVPDTENGWKLITEPKT